MYTLMVLVTVALMGVSSVHYVYCAWTRQTSPVPATWILMVTTMSLSLWMYWHSAHRSWTGNIAVVSAFGNTLLILIGVIASHLRDRTLVVTFDAVQKACLAAGGAIVVFWSITKQPLISYTLVQGIALVGYIATIQRLRRASRSTEPLFVWITVLIASVSAIYPAYVKQDVFAWVYLARAVPSTLFMVLLIARIKSRMVSTSSVALP